MNRKLKTMAFFVPIQRTEEHDDYTLVEGYAYVNPRVASDRYNLTRGAMEAASQAYMEFPAVREMHGAIAAGTGISTEWDERGVKLTSKIVDPVARAKVREQVYRGYSVGVKPKVLRGNDVMQCDWYETSLVDRPADPDAVFTMVRIDGAPTQEVEAEVMERASFADYLADCAPSSLRDMALDYLWNSLWDIQWWDTNADGSEMSAEDKATAVRQTCSEFAEFMVGVLATGEIPNISEAADRVARLEAEAARTPEPITRVQIEETLAASEEIIVTRTAWDESSAALAALPETLERLETATTQISTLETERDETRNELTRVQTEHGAAVERVKELERMPTRKPPVRVPEAMARTFAGENPEAPQIAALRAELGEFSRMAPTSDERESSRRIGRISQIKSTLRDLGESA